MDVFERMDKAVRKWLFSCFEVIDVRTYVDACNTFMEAEEARRQSVKVSLPSTTAPWYEDREFAMLMWDALKKEGCVNITDDGEKKYATVVCDRE